MRILFQGDSITDAGSYGKEYPNLTGYTAYTAELIGEGHEYINRGISGNRAVDVLDRYDRDILDVRPDIMTMLIGINDVWRRFDSGLYESAETYGEYLREILKKTREDLPDTKIILMEPYLLPAPDKKYFRPALAEFIEVARDIAVEYADAYIPLDGLFALERMTTPWEELSADGVHPNIYGVQRIADVLTEKIRSVLIG